MFTKKITTLDLSDGQKIAVHRMNFKATRGFLKKFAVIAAQLSDNGKLTADSAKEHFVALIPKIQDMIATSEELVAHLVVHSSDLPAAQLDELDSVDALKLISASIAANYDDDLISTAAGFAKSLAGLIKSPSVA